MQQHARFLYLLLLGDVYESHALLCFPVPNYATRHEDAWNIGGIAPYTLSWH